MSDVVSLQRRGCIRRRTVDQHIRRDVEQDGEGLRAGQRELADPSVQQSIRDTLRQRKEQLLRVAYLTVARENAKITNYLAQQVLESSGKLPGPPAQAPAH